MTSFDLQRRDSEAGGDFVDHFVGDRPTSSWAYISMGIMAERCAARRIALQQFVEPGFELREKMSCTLSSVSPRTKSMLPMEAMASAISGAFHHFGQRLQIAETRRAHVHAVRVGGAVADHVVAEFAARRFNHLEDFACGDAEALGDDLEMVDEGLHLGLHLFAVGQHDMGRVRLPGAFGHAVHGLPDDAHALRAFLPCARDTGRRRRSRSA